MYTHDNIPKSGQIREALEVLTTTLCLQSNRNKHIWKRNVLTTEMDIEQVLNSTSNRMGYERMCRNIRLTSCDKRKGGAMDSTTIKKDLGSQHNINDKRKTIFTAATKGQVSLHSKMSATTALGISSAPKRTNTQLTPLQEKKRARKGQIRQIKYFQQQISTANKENEGNYNKDSSADNSNSKLSSKEKHTNSSAHHSPRDNLTYCTKQAKPFDTTSYQQPIELSDNSDEEMRQGCAQPPRYPTVTQVQRTQYRKELQRRIKIVY